MLQLYTCCHCRLYPPPKPLHHYLYHMSSSSTAIHIVSQMSLTNTVFPNAIQNEFVASTEPPSQTLDTPLSKCIAIVGRCNKNDIP
mmetsp:Transcript_41076/g.63251  ORF Transcript_41076/g.63251 Transcript_41076/m.63251 type:complete len:86 (+) Transcript_41076:853-1110(+)